MKMRRKGKKVFAFALLVLFAIILVEGGLVSAAYNPDTWYGAAFDFFGIDGDNFQEVILAIIVVAIIYAGIFDILKLLSIFHSRWVKVIISLGIAIAAGMTGMVIGIVGWSLKLVGTLGAIGILLEIIAAIVIFVGLSWGQDWAQMWATKRAAKAAEAGGEMAAAGARIAIKLAKATKNESEKGPQ